MSVELEVHKGESKAFQYLSVADLENLRNTSSQAQRGKDVPCINTEKHELTCVAV